MAIISFTNYKRGQTSGCMGAVIRYTMQEKKTLWDGQRLVTGINCQPESVYADFMTTKHLYHKTDGVMFYHMVQSFPKGDVVDPVTAHAAALKLAEYHNGHEVLVSVQYQTSQFMSAGSGWSDVGIPADVVGGVVSAMVVLPQCLDDTPIKDSTASQAHTDRKAMRKQRQKKIALGHAEDERTERFDFQMNM